MNTIGKGSAVLAVILALAAPTAQADIGINPRASTLGIGAHLTWGVNDSVSIGFEANRFDKDITDSYGGINYRYGIDSSSFAVLGHWYPAGKGGVFRFTGGLYRNDSQVNGTAVLTSGSSYTIGNNSYTAAQIGNLNGVATFDKNAPYVGIGWGGRPGERFGFTFDLGAMAVGSPRVSLSTSGGVVTAADLEIERQQVENDFRRIKWFPLVAIGVYIRF